MTTSLKSLTFTTAITLLALGTGVRAEPIDLSPDAVTLIDGAMIEEHAGRTALALGRAVSGAPIGFGSVVLNDVTFENGTIEYDVMFGDTITFAGALIELA